MRELKFRYRCPSGEEMVYDDPGVVLQLGENGYKENIMQYTGLKDRDGKEIYEGDIYYFESSHKFPCGIMGERLLSVGY